MVNHTQLISKRFFENFSDIKISSFESYDSFNSFKFNVFDLTDAELWNYGMFNSSKYDLPNLEPIIENIKNFEYDTTFVFILPGNISITTRDSGLKSVPILNNKSIITNFIAEIANYHIGLIYGRNVTLIDDVEFSADFFFKKHLNASVINTNIHGDATIIKINNFIFTTLYFDTLDSLKKLINSFKSSYKEFKIPHWFNEVKCFNDQKELENIQKNKTEILILKDKINLSQQILNNNNEYKSVLYTQSDALVNVVLKMFDEMLNTDLSNFKDVYKEDFYFEYEDTSFIGEIKGVNRNLKKEYLNQLNDYAVDKSLEFDELDKDIKLKQLMIINTFRERHPNNRPKIEDETIEKAIRNDALIITTPIFLKLFEMFKQGEIESCEILWHLKNDVGVFKI